MNKNYIPCRSYKLTFQTYKKGLDKLFIVFTKWICDSDMGQKHFLRWTKGAFWNLVEILSD
jgi:hypothetical protein